MDFKNLSADKLKDTLSQAEALMKNLPEEQLQKMMAMFQTMSPKERESIMEKAKKFGLG
ncbi:MAG: hypothetical protein NTV34_17255 [Proteobacteria bacterium]|nr:hypothetical protein [Pseudomonadota bacterium]